MAKRFNLVAVNTSEWILFITSSSIIAQSSGLLIRDECKRARRSTEYAYTDEISNARRIIFIRPPENLHFRQIIIYLIFRSGFRRYSYQTEFLRWESDGVSFLK